VKITSIFLKNMSSFLDQNWPFDNLCMSGELVEDDTLWQKAGARDGKVWTECVPHLSTRNHYSLSLWASPQPWMSVEHAHALRIYCIGAVTITVTLALYFWGRSALNLVQNLFCTYVAPPRDDEDRIPSFSERGSEVSAYVPHSKTNDFMFPLLATDLSLLDTKHIPWQCDYDLTNLAGDIGEDATRKGLARAFSVAKRYNASSKTNPTPKRSDSSGSPFETTSGVL
jgi:hypothetical protein